MTFQVPAKVLAVFGSQTRAKMLGYLAASSVPQTGYAISRSMGIGISKVYRELKRLESCGVLVGKPDTNGRRRFLLDDEDLRNFLVKNMRILPAEEWFSPERTAARRQAFVAAKRILVSVPPTRLRVGDRPFADEFRRPPEKERALKRMRKASARP